MSRSVTRRQALVWAAGLAGGISVLAACGASGATAPSAPATGGQAPAPTPTVGPPAGLVAPQGNVTPAAAPAQSAANPAPAAPGQVQLRLMRFAGVGWEQDTKFVDDFTKANPKIAVKGEDIIYGDMYQKCLALGATGTLADLFAGHNKWMPYLAYKGLCLQLDSLVNTHATEMKFDDFFPSVIADAKGIGTEGKLYWLPTIVHPAGNAIVMFNLDLLKKAGVEAPASSDWTIDQYEQIVRKAADPKNGIYGTHVELSSPLYADQYTRTWGSDPQKGSEDAWLLSRDGRKQQLDSPPVKAAFEWYWKLVKDGFVPLSDAQPPGQGGDFFTAGQMVSMAAIIGQEAANAPKINGKFQVKSVLWPKGPHGYRGSCLSYNTYAINAKTQHQEESFMLLNQLTGHDIGLWATLEGHANPYARNSIWSDPKLWEKWPVTKDAAAWFQAGIDPFPQPQNLRFPEWLDAWGQQTHNYLDGKEDWNAMFPHTQKACQDILDQPRP